MLNRTKNSPTKLTPPAWGPSKNPKIVESQIELRFSTKPQKFKLCPQISPHQFLVPTTRHHPTPSCSRLLLHHTPHLFLGLSDPKTHKKHLEAPSTPYPAL